MIEYIKEEISQVELASTTKDPNILIEILRKGKDDSVSRNAAYNPNCPPDILKEVLIIRKNDTVCWSSASNPNCPTDILIEILRKGKKDVVSRCAFRNPNCPLEYKIKWMQLTGQIEKEDPSKHIIEYENIKQDDFQDLKDLL